MIFRMSKPYYPNIYQMKKLLFIACTVMLLSACTKKSTPAPVIKTWIYGKWSRTVTHVTVISGYGTPPPDDDTPNELNFLDDKFVTSSETNGSKFEYVLDTGNPAVSRITMNGTIYYIDKKADNHFILTNQIAFNSNVFQYNQDYVKE